MYLENIGLSERTQCKVHILLIHDSIYMKVQNKNIYRQKGDQWMLRAEGGGVDRRIVAVTAKGLGLHLSI